MNSSLEATAGGRKSFKMKLQIGAVSGLALLVAMPVAVIAQEAPQQPETVVVTGLRGSLQRAVMQKKISDMITEQISAEQIGKLPDPSIAESLARLPGLMGQRVNGEVEVVNMRGTSPDFTTTLLNGRQQGTVGDGRGVEVNQYPGELMGGVTVYKTPDASVAGQGLSGTIDLKTIRPLSQRGRKVSIRAAYDTTTLDQLNPDVDKGGWRGSAAYINQYMDGTLGVAFGYAHSQITTQTQYQEIWGYDGGFSASTTAANAPIVNGHTTRALSNRKTRDGFAGVIEYKPNDNSHTTVDLYYSKYKQEEVMRGIEGPMASWTNPPSGYTRQTTVPYGGTIVTNTGLITNVVPILNSQFHGRDDSVISGGINHEMKAGIWDIELDLSYSKAEQDAQNVQLISSFGQARAADTFGLDWNPDGFTSFKSNLNYGNASSIYLGDSAPGGWGEGFSQQPHVEDSYAGFDFKAATDIKDSFVGGLFSRLELGANFSDHDKLKTSTDDDVCFKNYVNVASTFAGDTQGASSTCGFAAVPGTYRRSTSSISGITVGNADLSFAGLGPIAAYDVLGTLNSLYRLVGRNDGNAIGRNWTLNEQVFTAFTRLKLDTEFMGRHIGGNVGVQFVDTTSESTGGTVVFSSVTGGGGANSTAPRQLTTVGNHYTDVLPSVNVNIDLTDKLKLRLAAAKQMARPRPDELRASFIVNVNNYTNFSTPASCTGTIPVAPPTGFTYACLSGNGGNAKLKPWRANAYDASLEYYLSSKSNIVVAGFYKEIDSFIYNVSALTDLSPYIANIPANTILLANVGSFNAPRNGAAGRGNKDAYIKGFEAAANLDFGDIFPNVPFIDGFGFSGSYNRNMTNIAPSASAVTAGRPPILNGNSLPGFSKEAHSLTVYYEKYGLEARVSKRYRSGVNADVAGFFANREFSRILPDEQVDAQIRYTFSDGPLDGLSLSIEGSNITDTLFQRQNGTMMPDGSLLPWKTERYGARYLFGVAYKF